MDTPIKLDLAADTAARPAGAPLTLSTKLGIFLELAKARLAALVVLTTLAAFLVAARGRTELIVLLACVGGTALTAAGANVLNQWREADNDRRMRRTRHRPLPSGRVSRATALRWGLWSSGLGLVVLATGVNLLTAALALLVLLLYVLVYTPLKQVSPMNTLVGAVCGAIPPVMGWTGATGGLALGAWIFFAILFLWQIPHFLALAWLYRDDYASGGFAMLPSVDPGGTLTGQAALVYALALLPVTGLAYLQGLGGTLFVVAAVALGATLTWLAAELLRHRSAHAARRLFMGSVLYLPLLLGMMVVDPGRPVLF